MEHIDQSLKSLFVALHTSGLWEDEKTISDAILKHEAEDILAAFERERTSAHFDLKAFFEKHFELDTAQESSFSGDARKNPVEHINALWPYLHRPADAPVRSTKVSLPFSYIVPGGRFQEVYYWDSYFTQLGLLSSNQISWVTDILDNFAYLIETFGHIPNGNRTYYLTRSQPPFFALMVDALAQHSSQKADEIYSKYLPALETEYTFWTQPKRTHNGLTTYYDSATGPRIEMLRTDLEWAEHASKHPKFYQHLRAACESGWDFSSRWLADPQDLGSIRTLDILPVDLNSLLYFHENLLFKITGNVKYEQAAAARKKALQHEFYCPDSGFSDLLLPNLEPTGRISAAMLYPLFVNSATKEQATYTAELVQKHLLKEGGIVTTPLHTGQQWDAPNGWAPLNYIAVIGLHQYGHTALAREIAGRFLYSCQTVYERSTKFVEKYDVCDPNSLSSGGEYQLQDGFGWSNGVYLALVDFLHETA